MLSAGLRLVSGGRIEPAAPACARCRRGRPKSSGLPAGRLTRRRAGRPHPLRSRRALRARSGDAAFALPQHAVRSGAAGRARQADDGCRPHRPRIGFGQRTSPERMGAHGRLSVMGLALALALGYLFGSIPFGLMLTRARRRRRSCDRSARAISARPTCCAPGARSSPRATLLLDALKGTLAVVAAAWLFGADDGACAAAGAPFSAISIPSGSAFAAARASRRFSAA